MVERLLMEVAVHFIYPLVNQRICHNADEHHRYEQIIQTLSIFSLIKSFHPTEMRHDASDHRYTSNVVANRFKPLIAYTSPNSNTYDRSSAIVNLPPAPNSTSLPIRHGNVVKREQTEIDQLTKLLMKSMNSSSEPNFFGESTLE